MSSLSCGSIECLPIVHGRLAFALEARRRLRSGGVAALAVELPPSLKPALEQALDLLPRISVILYREQPAFLEPRAPAWYVPIQPADAIVEALRLARDLELPVYYVDAEVEDFQAQPAVLPDPLALDGLGIEGYYRACLPILARHPRAAQDELRERHMAARLSRLEGRHAGELLFLCGMAHWQGVRRFLETGGGAIHPGAGPPPQQIQWLRPRARSLPFLMGELPFVAGAYEKQRRRAPELDFDPVRAVKDLLLVARRRYQREWPGSLERADPQALRTLLDFARKMAVRRGFLLPSSYTLTVAARGVVGNDYALAVLDTAHRYPWQGAERRPDDASPPPLLAMTADRALLDGEEIEARSRAPGSAFEYGRLRLERRPDSRRRKEYLASWNLSRQCSWPPEDLVIENFRDYVGRRALSLARVARSRSEPFTTSYLDGLDLRATTRDVVERRVWVKEEPRLPGAVGAVVMVFEEDDFGERYPWRSCWFAEHAQESTLVFYATDFLEDLVGPGVARACYGGCLLIFPPKEIPDPWDDPRLERARTPSERLLLAAILHADDHYVVHLAKRPPAPAVKDEARRRRKHVLHLPLSTFSARALERVRRFHVLNGREVRGWAQRFVR